MKKRRYLYSAIFDATELAGIMGTVPMRTQPVSGSEGRFLVEIAEEDLPGIPGFDQKSMTIKMHGKAPVALKRATGRRPLGLSPNNPCGIEQSQWEALGLKAESMNVSRSALVRAAVDAILE